MTADAAEIVRLAERVEQATGPDRELDAAIAIVTGWEHQCDTARWGIGAPHWYLAGRAESEVIGSHLYGTGGRLPFFTASLDAAMTLVPEGCFARIYGDGAQGIIVRPFSGSYLEVARGFAATPALALTAAALRARAASALSDGEG